MNYLIFGPAMLVYLCSLWGGLSSDNFFGLWVFMELNLLIFVFVMMVSSSNEQGVELKYFLVQSLASAGFLASFLATLPQSSTFFELMLIGSVLLKLAAAPVHSWLPQICEGLSWDNLFLLSTAQKIIPLKVAHFLVKEGVVFVVLSSVLLVMLGGVALASLKRLFALSSIFSVSWLLMGSFTIALIFLLTYGTAFLVISSTLKNQRVAKTSSAPQVLSSSALIFVLASAFVNLAGLPPFSLFYWKVVILLSSEQASYVASSGLILGSLYFVYLYLRVFILKISFAEGAPLSPEWEGQRMVLPALLLSWGWLLMIFLHVGSLR